jgi:twitching motility two-component system response regulator PilG
MSDKFNPIQLLNEISQSATTGQLQITANSVIWKLSLVEGKLQSATHSLQSWETIKYYWQRLGYNTANPINSLMTHEMSGNDQLAIVNKLIAQGDLNSTQKTKLMAELTRDALESLLCLTQGQQQWLSEAKTKEENLLELPPLIECLKTKLEGWQKLNPFILSPHQRPYCHDLFLLEKSVASGTLSIGLLKQLVKLMQGISIRHLALFVKQDDLKLAQLLLPYIKNKMLQLYPPKSPLDLLPQIPASLPQHQPNQTITNRATNRATPTATITPLKPAQEKYKIVCIDDSPAMLDIIQTYLGTEKYQLLAIEDPMKCLSFLFKSKPDLILMDISMPGINGNRLCQILKNSPIFQQVPIILISGNTKILNQETIQSTGATDFLAKPFRRESLLNIVEKHCQQILAKVS